MLTSKELAERLKMSEGTLRNWRCYGKGPKWIRVGGAIRYRESDVKKWEGKRK
jgi:predicted site-specific integrase-resolvase